MKWGVSIAVNFAGLTVAAAITSIAVSWVYCSTKAQIEYQVRREQANKIFELFPEYEHDNRVIDDTFMVESETSLLRTREAAEGFRVRKTGAVVGVILPATARDGYSGDIRTLVGIRLDGSISGVRVVSHHETLGLGDLVDLRRSDWVRGFDNRSLTDPPPIGWNVKKNGGVFDQFTGATITPRAVIHATRRALEYANLHKVSLFELESDSP
mgnify:FL=1